MNNDVSTSQNASITTTPIEIPDSEPLALDDDVQIINNQANCVNLDDDSDVIIEENTPVIVDIDSDDLEIIETNNTPIVIDDEGPNRVINPLNVIKKKQDQLFDTVCQENSSLAQLIEEAINLDASGSMKRIIQRMLIPLYLNCKTSFKESEFFKNTLKRTTLLLETTPHLKYSHIKSLCETLKYSLIKFKEPSTNGRRRKKRKQQQTKQTIQTSASSPKKRKYTYKKNRRHKKRKQNATNVDQTKQKKKRDNTESIDPRDSNTSNTMIEIEISNITTSISPTSDKENRENIEITNNTTHDTVNNNTGVDPNNLLQPHYAVITQMPLETTQQKVESLEKQIAFLKNKLEMVEEQEVVDDNELSPYIRAETIKAQIVKLYQYLCDLMGAEPTKRHEVKLKIVNGHPPGPARCLEEYINDNIDEYGNPPFPNIFEVVRCVERAVEEDRLPWNRKQIVAEAQVLLKHYGHAIQKRRMKREWRDMVTLCKEELVDPAELDPALEAKLLENSRIAKKNENEILEKYARLEKENSSNPELILTFETADDTESDDEDIREPSHNNTPVENNIQEAPTSTVPDSTTNIENIQVNPSILNSDIVQPNSQGGTNTRHYLEINPQSGSNIIESISVLREANVANADMVQNNARNESLINSTSILPSNVQSCPMILVNTPNNSIPNIHGRICYINSTPVFATRIQDCSSFINSTNNLEGNLQNGPNNLAGNLQNGPKNLAGNLQNGLNFINSNYSASNMQNGPNFINSNNLAGNLQNISNFINSNNFEGNLQSGYSFINSNILAGNLQSRHNFINSSNNLEGSLHNRPSIINTSNNLASNPQNGPNKLECNLQNGPNNLECNRQNGPDNLEGNLKNGPNNLECNLQNGPNNLEGNLQNKLNNTEGNQNSCPIDSTTDTETQSIKTNIGNVEYNRTITMDSNESDTDNERKEPIDIARDTNTVKEPDKSDIDEIEYKFKIKQEEDDVMKLLNELGSDCVATVFDIEDPFLVIEISDSSDDEE